MSDDDNTASELPFEEENSFSGDGDIEQGGKIVAVIASETILDGDGQRSSSAGLGGATSTPTPSTTTTAWPCDTQCCSSKYSEDADGDKLLKCISVGGFKISEGCVGRGEEDRS